MEESKCTIVSHIFKFGDNKELKYVILDHKTNKREVKNGKEIESFKMIQDYWLKFPKSNTNLQKKEVTVKTEKLPTPIITPSPIEVKHENIQKEEKHVKQEIIVKAEETPKHEKERKEEKHEKEKPEKTEKNSKKEKQTKRKTSKKDKMVVVKPKTSQHNLWKDQIQVEILGYKNYDNKQYICIRNGSDGYKLVELSEAKNKFPAQLATFLENFITFRDEDTL
ncbi:hypothetical protein TVAG_360690 [Trichomonas vaginalis G3]|uniref:Uncharacterized protein n=1 Tax=Trichomonas vaginalis (strain ATCC PRA-98 / G3) TaxID=412133 RepID=A2FLK8_TRIV3|nr:hypothetical protein TVAGG3_0100870 [Trichomonas vaginalis G3]EAX94222.1 hypothetical protein TVAG_360690 [Trichomonas vaginalis G3]KAI5544379.1 hypothetical protein TVAGG3_0100870 [Trichomonas vaginalis G3]|eukprot:XP_001307152.1 hypothetical protein [Trichomonas vaginalis G3]